MRALPIGWSGRVDGDKLLEKGRALTDAAKRGPIYAQVRNYATICR
jgi:hypothetical protein